MDDTSNYLAENLKAFRAKRNYTQQEFSKLSGVPRSTLTNIESGEANPSLSNVMRIADALGVGVDQLISRPRASTMLFREEDLLKEVRGNLIEITKLFPDKQREIAIDKFSISPGETHRGQPHLNGTKEYLTIIKGTLEIHVTGEKFVVQENEVLAFPGDVFHSYRNIGAKELIFISVVLPTPV